MGAITGNGPPISSTGKLHVWVLTYVRDHVCILPACNISFFVGGGKFDGLSLYILLYVTTVSSGSDYHYHIYYFVL